MQTTKILVVDDEKLIRLTISAKLKKEGYEVVSSASVADAVATFKKAPRTFSAIISDIMMGEMDGFVFRDIVRGIEPKIPIFFLTALDPEEGGGFLRRILDDAISYYLPKAVNTDVLLNRVRQVVASHRVEAFIQNKIAEDRKSLELASHIQRSLLPARAIQTQIGFYTAYWRPVDVVSGDLIETIPFGPECYMYVLGDIQGHGTSAALAMTAVQSFLKNLGRMEGSPMIMPSTIANMLQSFFRENLANVSYMTALICIHRPRSGIVRWMSCGAPDLLVSDGGVDLDVNPNRRGGLPIGLFPDTVYSTDDVVETKLSDTAICFAYTDGIMDISRDKEGEEMVPAALSRELRQTILESARRDGSCMAMPAKFMKALAEFGYTNHQDDISLLIFGATVPIPGMYEATVKLLPSDVDLASKRMAEWCRGQGWPEEGVAKLQLVLEEKLMNIHDHGLDDQGRLREVVSLRLRCVRGLAELTVWDTGTEEPSAAVAAGDSATAFELANQNMSDHGRGRLIVREICDGIERNRYPPLNETIYHIPVFGKDADAKNDAKETQK